MSARDDAIEAAERALYSRQRSYQLTNSEVEALAARAVDAAAPILLADLRERLAAAIEAQFVGQDHHEPTYNSGRGAGLRLAERIVRERP